MPVITIRFDQIEPNPYRDIVANPPSPGQIEVLKDSIELTSFWDGLLVREHPRRKGHYQLAFGHSRLEAAKLHGLTSANFNVVELSEADMIRHLGVENSTQRGHEEYATYREVVGAAIEHIMGEVVRGQGSPLRDWLHEDARTDVAAIIKQGGMPGVDIIGRFFGGVLSNKAIRMVIEEYKATGRLAAWHAAHNPKAENHAEPPTLSAAALSRFRAPAHVKTFADTMRSLEVPVEQQPAVADAVLETLKEPEVKPGKSQTPENKRLTQQYARTDQPRNERLTSTNIRAEAHKVVSRRRRSPKERDALQAKSHAISIEGALAEMSIGLRRAAAAASDISRVAGAIGGLRVDLTPSSELSLGQCRDAIRAMEGALKAAAKHGVRIPLLGA